MEIIQNAISMIRGDSETITVSCKDASGLYTPFIDGDKIYFTVKKSVNDTVKVLQKVVTTFDDGKAIIEIRHDDTKDIECGVYMYDIQLSKLDGTVTTIIKPSRFVLNNEVTYE